MKVGSPLSLLIFVAMVPWACSKEKGQSDTFSSNFSQGTLLEATNIDKNSNGTWKVRCSDSTVEDNVKTEDLQANKICKNAAMRRQAPQEQKLTTSPTGKAKFITLLVGRMKADGECELPEGTQIEFATSPVKAILTDWKAGTGKEHAFVKLKKPATAECGLLEGYIVPTDWVFATTGGTGNTAPTSPTAPTAPTSPTAPQPEPKPAPVVQEPPPPPPGFGFKNKLSSTTAFKATQAQASDLPDSQKCAVPAGYVLRVKVKPSTPLTGHKEIELAAAIPGCSFGTLGRRGFVFAEHFEFAP